MSTKPLIIGHRGACGYRPEHTLASYGLAIEMGADFIEPDLVITKDGVLIARHENEISATTDVQKKFPKRRSIKTVDGKKVEGWFAEDFTLAEIKQLKAKERLDFRSHDYDFIYDIPTFEEILAFVKEQQEKTRRIIGIYPELKHSTYFSKLNLKLEDRFLALLNKYGYTDFDSPVIVQSFEVSNLKYLHQLTKVRLVQLFDDPELIPFDLADQGDQRTYLDLTKPAELQAIAKYAYGIGPHKGLILPVDKDQQLLPKTSLIHDAHRSGLVVHTYTFRNEEKYLAKDYNKDPLKEYLNFFTLGVDGVFTDFTDVAIKARERFH
jgi:glycerophosphoryl diester phosphodiesterase